MTGVARLVGLLMIAFAVLDFGVVDAGLLSRDQMQLLGYAGIAVFFAAFIVGDAVVLALLFLFILLYLLKFAIFDGAGFSAYPLIISLIAVVSLVGIAIWNYNRNGEI